MSYENFPKSNNPEQKPVAVKNNNSRNILTGILIVALLAHGVILFMIKIKPGRKNRTYRTNRKQRFF